MIPTDVALGIMVLLLTLAFFLSLIDVAFHYFSNISIRASGEESWKMEFLRHSIEDPSRLLLPLRIGIQGAFIAMTVLVTEVYIASEITRPLLAAFFTMLPLFLVFREVLPNIVARKSPERILLALLPAFRVYEHVITPISRPLSRLVRVFVDTPEKTLDEDVSEEEIQAFIETGEEHGIFEGDEGRMVQSIVDFGDKIVREVMTPRPEMVAIRRDVSLGELRKLFVEEKYSRIGVYEENLDQILGVVFAIDLLERADEPPDSPIESLIRPVQFVPETKKILELLREFQRSQSTFAIVVDEYGGTSGLVTVEDILEEIVGEIHDEFDEVGEDIIREREGVFLVSGRADIDLVQEQLDLDLGGEGFETVSGFVLDALGRVPQPGEVIDFEGLKIEVVEAEGHRIDKVRFRLKEKRHA